MADERADLQKINQWSLGNGTNKFGKCVRWRRQMLGISQQELAKRTGLEQSAISKIENCKNDPTLSKVVLIIKALGGKRCFLGFSADEIKVPWV